MQLLLHYRPPSSYEVKAPTRQQRMFMRLELYCTKCKYSKYWSMALSDMNLADNELAICVGTHERTHMREKMLWKFCA